jgi:hypothetical protein
MMPFYFQMTCPIIITNDGLSESMLDGFPRYVQSSLLGFSYLVLVHSFSFILIIALTRDANCLLCSGAQHYLVSSAVMCGIYL